MLPLPFVEHDVDLINLHDPLDHNLLYQDMSNKESNHSVNLNDVGYLFEDKEDIMDDTKPTGTAAIPQGQVVFYNDPNPGQVQDQPTVDQPAAILPAAALPTVNVEEEPSNPETTSQNAAN